MEKLRPSFTSENTSQKMFIGTDKISETVNDMDSEGGSFSELSDSNMCKANSPFCCCSSSKEEGVVQPQPDRSSNRTCWTLPKHANTNFELGCKEQIQTVQKPAFSGIPGINKNFHITQDSSPWDIQGVTGGTGQTSGGRSLC